MAERKARKKAGSYDFNSFSHFISQPPISVAIIAFALLALVFALFDLGQAI